MVEGAVAENALLRWIPLLPGAAAAIHGVLLGVMRRPIPRTWTIALSCGSVILAFLLSFVAMIQLTGLPEGQRVMVDGLFTWIGAGSFSAEMAFLLDPLSAVMILFVTGVGSLIHVYSIGYMDDDHREDRGFQRFFCYLNLFTFAMLMLVLGDNLLVMFLGWEGVGLCSYLLIGFWFADRWNAYCGTKAFVVNRIGDFGFLVGIFLLFWALFDAGSPTVSFRGIEAAFPALAEQTVALPGWLHWLPGAPEWRLATLIGLCFFVGAAGKSAQIPLYVWLPDAMAGPTPVSALIHAATMVTAGVYMVCRLSFLYAAAPGASTVIAWIGALTAILAAVIAIAQTDIKKVLAYSTVSQLGYMFLAAGVGAYSAAMFHVVTHAFFKALLFLGAGAVILAVHHEQDTDRMGGLRRMIPVTHLLFGLGVVGIIGFPPYLSAGFFSKDEILLASWLAHDVPGHQILYGIALFTAGLTAFYMLRLHFRTFFGSCRLPAETRGHVHEPARVVWVPLVPLAVLSVVGGYLGPSEAFVPIENANSFAHFLDPVLAGSLHHPPHALEWRLATVATAVVAAGMVLAWALYVARPELPARFRHAASGLHALVADKFRVDELYDRVFVRPLIALSDRVLWRGVDEGLIDGAGANGSARVVRGFASELLRHLQSGLAQGYLLVMVLGTLAIVGWMVR